MKPPKAVASEPGMCRAQVVQQTITLVARSPTTLTVRRALRAGRLLMLAGWVLDLALWPTASVAAPTDFRFEAISNTVERGVGVPLQVRVTSLVTGGPVPGVDVRDARVDRSPDGQRNGSLPAFYTPSMHHGIYGFRADLPVEGRWALTFSARVPGEAQPVTANVLFNVVARLTGPLSAR